MPSVLITSLFALAALVVAVPAAASELNDTAWRLVNIAEMDDSTDFPDDPAKYTLEFRAEGGR